MVQQKQNWAKSLTRAVNLATNVAAVLAIGLLGGRWLDIKYDTTPLWTILGFVLGAATAGKIMWDALMERERQKSATQNNPDQDQK
jgi:F0F1-type ATP synthase assembly protein I